MKRFLLFVFALTVCMACDTKSGDSQQPGLPSAGITDCELTKKLCSSMITATECEVEMKNGMVRVYDNVIYYLFSADATCKAYAEIGSEWYVSRTFSWAYNDETKVITTTDESGASYDARVLDYDDEKIVIEGNLCGEISFHATGDSEDVYKRELKFVAKSEEWSAYSYEVYKLGFVDEYDVRFDEILAKVSSDAEVDDKQFLDALNGSVFYVGQDAEDDTSGAVYGSIGIYPYYNGKYYYKTPYEVGGLGLELIIPNTLLFKDGGEGRQCVSYDEVAGIGYGNECRYIEFAWSYDSERNILSTNYLDKEGFVEAQVVYIDSKCAILKGRVLGYPPVGCDYAYFYADFTKYDYNEIEAKYGTKL